MKESRAGRGKGGSGRPSQVRKSEWSDTVSGMTAGMQCQELLWAVASMGRTPGQSGAAGSRRPGQPPQRACAPHPPLGCRILPGLHAEGQGSELY